MGVFWIALCASYLVQQTRGAPTLSFPLNAQLPPVARPGELFSYVFSSHTFQSSSNITYSLGSHPSWLSIDHAGRLYGTPQDDGLPPGDVIGQHIELIATDATGSTSANATLVVSRNKSPSVNVSITEQIQSFGLFSAPGSLLLYPSTNFKYAFDHNTFNPPTGLNYYATSNDSSPLPSWIQFDAANLVFSGRTPELESLIEPPQTFCINLVASDVVGFSAAYVSFSIVVGRHKLTAENPIVSLNVSKGSQLRYDNLQHDIKLDNKTVQPGSLNVSIENMPPWLTYLIQDGSLRGVPKDGDHSANFTINFQDQYQDTLSVLFEVNVDTRLFLSTPHDVQARQGEKISVDLTSYLRDPQDIDLKLKAIPQASWLKVDGFNLVGKVPKNAKGDISATIEAVSKNTGFKETEMIHVHLLAADGTTIPSSSSSDRLDSGSSNHSSRANSGKIVLATLLPIFIIASVIALLVCFVRRRRRRRQHTYLSEKQDAKMPGPILSGLLVMTSGLASHRHVKKVTGIRRHQTSRFKNGRRIDADARSQKSARPRSSETMGRMSVLEAPPAILATGTRSPTIRSARTPNPVMQRDSWVTVDDILTTSESSIGSCRSGTDSPTSDFATESADRISYRSTVDLNVAALADLSNMRTVTPAMVKTTGKTISIGGQSMTTLGSAALPVSQPSYMRLFPRTPEKWPPQPPKRPVREAAPLGEMLDVTPELRRPPIPPPNQQAFPSCPVLFTVGKEGSTIDRTSVVTASSFGSSENWRVIGRQDTFRTMADPYPIHETDPLRLNPLIDGTEPPGPHAFGRPSLDLMSPSKWGDDDSGEDRRRIGGEAGEEGSRPPRLPSIIGSGLHLDGDSRRGDGEATMKAIHTMLRRDSATISEESLSMLFI